MARELHVLALLALAVAGIGFLAAGCEGDGSGNSGSSAIEGNLVSFQNAGVDEKNNYVSIHPLPIAKVFTTTPNVPPGMGGPGGITVSITGPETLTTVTADDGTFSFTGLPAGDYGLSFEYNGEEVRYRGESGQKAMITVDINQKAELLDIRINGGKVNIGNVRISTPTNEATEIVP